MGIQYSLIVKNLTMMREIAMSYKEEHKHEHYRMEEFPSDKIELCPDCHGSGSNGDGTCSSCNGTGII